MQEVQKNMQAKVSLLPCPYSPRCRKPRSLFFILLSKDYPPLPLLSHLPSFFFIFTIFFFLFWPHCTACRILVQESQTRDGTMTPELESGSLNHWISWKVLHFLSFTNINSNTAFTLFLEAVYLFYMLDFHAKFHLYFLKLRLSIHKKYLINLLFHQGIS